MVNKRPTLIGILIVVVVIIMIVSVWVYIAGVNKKNMNQLLADLELSRISEFREDFVAPSLDDGSAPSVEEMSGIIDTLDTGVSEEDIRSANDTISELWFKVRRGDVDPSEFLEQLSKTLENGIIPMVVDRFPLVLISDEDYGFTHNVMVTNSKEVRLISAVMPKGMSPKVTNFLVYRGNEGVEVLTLVKDIVPSYFGRSKEGNEVYFFVGGEVVDDKLYTEEGTIYLMGIEVSENSVKLLEVSDEVKLETVDINVDGSVVFLTAKGTGVSFYKDIIDEGQTTDDLFIITGTGDSVIVGKVVLDEDRRIGLVSSSTVER